MKNKIKGVIFDMDGVLIEAKEWHYEALNKALGLFGYTISKYDHLVTYDGLPTVMKLDMLSRERDLPFKLHDFINELKQKFTMELVYTNCKPRFDHEYALSSLKSNGYKIGCASNSIRESVNIMLTKSNLVGYMDTIFSAQDVDNPKPAPDMYTAALNALGLRPDECLIVEDNENGIKAAIASGAHLMRVTEVNEVNFENIMHVIGKIEQDGTIL
jgi:beta-phosphoglucomutase